MNIEINALATAALLVPGMAESLREFTKGGGRLNEKSAALLAVALNGLLRSQDTEAMQEAADEAAGMLADMLARFATVSRVAVNGDVWALDFPPHSMWGQSGAQSRFAGCVYRVSVHVAGVEIPALSHLQGVEDEDGEEDTAWRVPVSAMRADASGAKVVNTWSRFEYDSIFDMLTN